MLGTDSGVQMPTQRPRPVGIDEAERENQRQRHQERLDNQQFAVDLEREARGARGFDPSQSEAADAAEFERRKRARDREAQREEEFGE